MLDLKTVPGHLRPTDSLCYSPSGFGSAFEFAGLVVSTMWRLERASSYSQRTPQRLQVLNPDRFHLLPPKRPRAHHFP